MVMGSNRMHELKVQSGVKTVMRNCFIHTGITLRRLDKTAYDNNKRYNQENFQKAVRHLESELCTEHDHLTNKWINQRKAWGADFQSHNW